MLCSAVLVLTILTGSLLPCQPGSDPACVPRSLNNPKNKPWAWRAITDCTARPSDVCTVLCKGSDVLLFFYKPPQSRRLLGCFDTRVHCWIIVNLVSTRTPGSFSAKLLSRRSALACPHARGYSSPGAGHGISLCWTSRGLCEPTFPACRGPSDWHHKQLAYQSLLIIHTGIMTPSFDFLPTEMEQPWALKCQFLKINQHPWTALLFRALSHKILPWTAPSLVSWSTWL